MMSDIFVKVVRIPGAVTEVALSQGATVADAMSAAGISSSGSESIRVGAADAVGAARKRALLAHFGSAKAVGRANLSDLKAVDGVSVALAERIYAFFHERG